jgi:hypothetical protein
MDAAGQLAQLLERLLELGARSVELAGDVRIALHPRAQQAQAERERDQSLLSAVVQIALEATTRRVARLDDPGPGGPQLLDFRPQLGVEPLVLERQRGGRPDRADELALVLEARRRG